MSSRISGRWNDLHRYNIILCHLLITYIMHAYLATCSDWQYNLYNATLAIARLFRPPFARGESLDESMQQYSVG